jgi:predicted Zn finger-like uncharacterized protein
MFKVVTDQLKVSQGWVRCGHCSEVFDASKYLLPRDESKALSSLAAASVEDRDYRPQGDNRLPSTAGFTFIHNDADQTSEAAAPTSVADVAVAPDAAGPPATPARTFPRWGSGHGDPVDTAPTALTNAADSAADFDPAGWKEALQRRQLQEDGAASAYSGIDYGKSLTHTPSDFVGLAEEPPRRPDLVRKATVSDAEFDEELDAMHPPVAEAGKDVSFVVDAERKDFWRRPMMRGMLLGFSMVLVLLLGLQFLLQQKDSLAASEPKLNAALQALCGALGCQIQPPRHVESLVIDSSTFNRIAADAYRLTFVIKNTGSQPLEMPALELTLTDTQDQAVVRRVLLPAQFGVNSSILASRAEIPGIVNLRVMGEGVRANTTASPSASVSLPSAANSLRVAGYRVLVFYP